MSARNEDFLFAQEAQSLGYVTEAQVEEGFLLQKRMADDLQIDERLAVILVKRGWIADEQARRVYGIIEPEGARTQIEGYRLVEKVGRGAMGTVYKAMHKGLNRVVAIKILRRDLAADKTQIERLKREAKLLAELEHPNVVRAFDAGESNGFPYLVMEFVDGETLRDKIARDGPLDEDEALRITRDLADALEKARRMGVVHRDVKPGNILISKDGTPKLMDLGLAKGPIDAGLTQHGATVGTPQFMSPEQAESPDKADTRSDIYSLGATLYAMVTGRPPFEGSTLAEIITKVMSQQPVPPGMVNKDVSSEVNHLIERMMLKDASLRYATPALVIQDIDLIRGGQSIIPGGFQGNWEAYLLRQRFLRWRKRLVIGFAATAVLVVGVMVYLDKRFKDGTRATMRSRGTKLVQMREPQKKDTQESLNRRLVSIQDEHAKLMTLSDEANVAYDERQNVEDKIDRLKAAHDLLVDIARLEAGKLGTVAAKRRKGLWTQALAEAQTYKTAMEKYEPSAARWAALIAAIESDSRRALRQGEDRVTVMPVADANDFLEKYRARDALYRGDWIEEGDYDRRQTAAEEAFRKAKGIGTALAAFQLAFAGDRVQARVDAGEYYDLRKAFAELSDQLRADVNAQVDSWPERPKGEPALVRSQLFGENGFVVAAIDAVDSDIDARVRAAWQDLKRRLPSMSVPEALEALDRFANEAERGNHYRYLADEARAEQRRIQAADDERRATERRAFEKLRRRVLVELRRGEPAAIHDVVDAALASGELTRAREKDARALREAALALEALQAGALVALELRTRGGRTPTLSNVRYRLLDDTYARAKQWVLREVDVEKGMLLVRVPGGDRRVVPFRVQLVSIPNLRAWMAQGPKRLSPLHDAILRIAEQPLPVDQPGVDLRPVLGSYRALKERFGEAEPGPQWRRLVGEVAERLDGWQIDREDEAAGSIPRAGWLFNDDDWKSLVELVDQLLDPEGRLRYTQAVENRIGDLMDKRRWAREALDKDELRRMFHGDVRPRELAGVPGQAGSATELLFDFDDVKQLQNFAHGFARWERTGGPVTPGRSGKDGGGQLRLLPDVQGFLRDRPLVLDSMFDSADPISVSFRANFLRGSALLAIDIDGVQVAIASFDPNFWKRRFRVEAPRLPGEEALPEFDFYGMGRGIAFHHGQHFGRSFPYGNWDWAVEGQGRNFVKLKERGVIDKAGGRLFAFEPGTSSFLVRVERDRNFLRLFVNDKLIYEAENHRWSRVGRNSRVTAIRNGTGRIQILTWTPMLLDDLVLRGTLREDWKKARRKAMKAAASKKAAEGDGKGGSKGGGK